MSESVHPATLDLTVQGWAHCSVRWERDRLVYYPAGWWVTEEPGMPVALPDLPGTKPAAWRVG